MHFVQFATAVSVLALFACEAYAQGAIEASPKVVKGIAPPYSAMSFVSEGPAHSFSDGAERGKYQRLVLLNLGLAYDRPTIRIETLTYGDEGCCRRIAAAWELDLNALPAGLSLPDAATSQWRFLRWQSARNIEFRYGDLTCKAQGLGSPKVKISCVK